MKVHLTNNRVYSWYTDESKGITVKGYVYNSQNEAVKEQALAALFGELSHSEDLSRLLQSLNGCFAVVINKGDVLLAAVDRLGSFPLFYHEESGEISDTARVLAGPNPDIDPVQANAFTLCTCTLGPDTLVHQVKQLQAGQMLQVSNTKPEVSNYYSHEIKHFHTNADLLTQLDEVTRATFNRFKNSVGNKPIALGLTAGLDSRLIACMLKETGCHDVICYTYGKADSYEVKIARQVAEKLGYPWHFVEMDRKLFGYYFSDEYQEYEQIASNYTCLPYEQDLLALHQLKVKELIAPDAVIVTGFCGDLLAGSWMFNKAELSGLAASSEGLVDYLSSKFFAKGKTKEHWKGVKEILSADTAEYRVNNSLDMASAVQSWGVKNRLGKYLFSALRSYEFLGHEWSLPLWDKDYTDFWYSVPIELRRDKHLYKNYLINNLFQPMGVDLSYSTIDNYFTYAGPLTFFRSIAPRSLRKLFKKLLVRKKDMDVNNFHLLYKMIHEKLTDPTSVKPDNDINFIEAYWYIERLRSETV